MANVLENVRRRARQFSRLENAIIVEQVKENKSELFGKFSSTLTKETKNNLWEKITDTVNSTCGENRSSVSIEKRWYNLQGAALKAMSTYKRSKNKTGGGTPPRKPEDMYITIVDEILAPPKVSGLGLGLDTLEVKDCLSETATVPGAPSNELLEQSQQTQVEHCEADDVSIESLPKPLQTADDIAVVPAFSDILKPRKAIKRKSISSTVEPATEIAELVHIEKSKLKTDEEKQLGVETQKLQLRRLKQEIEDNDRRARIEIKMNEVELKLKEAELRKKNLEIQVLEHEMSVKNLSVVYELPTIDQNGIIGDVN